MVKSKMLTLTAASGKPAKFKIFQEKGKRAKQLVKGQ